jgi:hypothetical protein
MGLISEERISGAVGREESTLPRYFCGSFYRPMRRWMARDRGRRGARWSLRRCQGATRHPRASASETRTHEASPIDASTGGVCRGEPELP